MKWISLLSISLFSTLAFAGPTTEAQIDVYDKALGDLNSVVICSNFTTGNTKNGENYPQLASNDLNRIYRALQKRNQSALRMDHLVSPHTSYELCAVVNRVN